MPKEHVLLGLEPDNLLAFLALLGLLRALEHAEPTWRSRAYWGDVPLRPRIALSEDVERDEFLDAAARGCATLAKAHSFDGRLKLDYSQAEARKLLREACEPQNRLRVDLLTALMSDAAAKDDKVRPTPFCLLFGQGHQNFLERLETVPNGIPPRELEGKITSDELNSTAMLEAALFKSWVRTDSTQSFRWDPIEDRRYALRFEDPSGEKGLTVHGANRLASLALPLLPVAPRRERGEVRIYAVATNWNVPALCVQWPIWSRPASLKSITTMLAGCGSDDAYPGLGILEMYRSERISVGKFLNFTRALPIHELRPHPEQL